MITATVRWFMGSFTRFVRSFQARGQEFFYKQSAAARKMGCSLRTLQRVIKELVAQGRLKVSRRGATSATYAIVESTDQAQLCLPLGDDPGGSSGGSKPVPSIYESPRVLRVERREAFTPLVLFLRPEGRKATATPTPKLKKPSLMERMITWYEKQGIAI